LSGRKINGLDGGGGGSNALTCMLYSRWRAYRIGWCCHAVRTINGWIWGPHWLLSTTFSPNPNGELQESQMPLLGCFNYPHSCWGHGYPIKG
jgi:hypothetical protein